MPRVEWPYVVDVGTASIFHYKHVKAAFEHGCDVLYEKPFVYDPALGRTQLLDQGKELMGNPG
jgi:predicted dehydrogenase